MMSSRWERICGPCLNGFRMDFALEDHDRSTELLSRVQASLRTGTALLSCIVLKQELRESTEEFEAVITGY
jgi:hypothetical protein